MPGLPQHDHADLGIDPEADQTEDLRPKHGDRPGQDRWPDYQQGGGG